MKVAVYTRVSTKGQGDDDRLGLRVQASAIDRFCELHGHEVMERYSDIGYSGANAERPGLAKLITDAAVGGFQGLVVAKGDRLARDTMLDGYLRFVLKRHGVSVLSALEPAKAEDPIGRLTQQVLAAVAEFERHLIRQRLLMARRAKSNAGGYGHGRPRFGMKALNRALVTCDEEQTAFVLMKQLRRRGKSYRSIAASLDAAGLPPRHGVSWARSTVHRILNRPNKKHRFQVR